METADRMDTMLQPTLTAPANLAGKPRCQARSKRSGEQCGRAASPGQRVCVSHGAGSPQAKLAARERLAALVDPALEALREVLDDPDAKPADKLRAAESVLDRTGHSRTSKVESTMNLSDAREILKQKLLEAAGL